MEVKVKAQNWTNTELGGIIGGSYRCPRLTADLTGRQQDCGVGANDTLFSPVRTGEVGELDL